MKYTKAPLTFSEQADRLLARGLVADRQLLVERLEVVNYYRLSAYWYTFRTISTNTLSNTTFRSGWPANC